MTTLATMPERQLQLSPLDSLVAAFQQSPTAEMAKQIADLQIQMERFRWEREERQSRIDFDDALNRCQIAIGEKGVFKNQVRENNIGWADYKQVDATIRPIYTAEGFSLTYSEAESPVPGKIRIVATLSRSGISKQFDQTITPGGNAKMSATDSDAAANSRAQRYLALKIFNIAVGIDSDEKAGMEEVALVSYADEIKDSRTLDELRTRWDGIKKAILESQDAKAMKELSELKDATKRKLQEAK